MAHLKQSVGALRPPSPASFAGLGRQPGDHHRPVRRDGDRGIIPAISAYMSKLLVNAVCSASNPHHPKRWRCRPLRLRTVHTPVFTTVNGSSSSPYCSADLRLMPFSARPATSPNMLQNAVSMRIQLM